MSSETKSLAIIVGVLGLFALALIFFLFNPIGFSGTSTQTVSTPSPSSLEDTRSSSPSGQLKIEDIQVGTGIEATKGSLVTVHYTGTLENGTKFDSSVDRGEPFTTPIGEGRVIKGWDEGIPGMKVGGKRRLTIPSEMGYGTRGSPPTIPPNATLIFDVELLEIKN